MEHALPDAPVDALDEGLRASVLSPSDSRVLTRVSFVSRDRVRVLGLPGLGIAAGDEMVVSDPILVGDWVVVDTGHEPFLVIHRVPRSSVLQRRKPKGGKQEVAANVDLALVCTPLGATAGPRRVERWLAIAAEAGIEALVVVTKVDPDVEAELDRDAYGDATVLGVSGRFGTGIPALLQRLPSGRTAALLGASGVGKSTLLNALLGREAQRVGAVRESDQRGRHTTTARTLHVLPQGAYLIDNPGVREVGLTRAHGVDAAFPEIERLLGQCRYRGCRHSGDEGCAVTAAVATGQITAERLDAWRKLDAEGQDAATGRHAPRSRGGAAGPRARRGRRGRRRK